MRELLKLVWIHCHLQLHLQLYADTKVSCNHLLCQCFKDYFWHFKFLGQFYHEGTDGGVHRRFLLLFAILLCLHKDNKVHAS